MMKMILICTLMTLIMIKVNGQNSDTLSNTLSYQKTFAKIGRFEIYGWTSYTWFWHEESGIGININLNKKRIHKKNEFKNLFWINHNLWSQLNFPFYNRKIELKEFKKIN